MSRPSEGPMGSAVPGIRDQNDFKIGEELESLTRL